MEANVTLDVGDNLSNLVQQLAQQIGTTADKVFPWYVKQQVLEGYLFFGVAGFVVLLALTVLLLSIRKANLEEGNTAAVCVVIFGFVLAVSSGITALSAMEYATKIVNPEFSAMKALARDVGRMRGR